MSQQAPLKSAAAVLAQRRCWIDACLETLATCRLNRYEPNELLECDYSITQPTQEQTAILRALGLTSLSRHQELAARITPR